MSWIYCRCIYERSVLKKTLVLVSFNRDRFIVAYYDDKNGWLLIADELRIRLHMQKHVLYILLHMHNTRISHAQLMFFTCATRIICMHNTCISHARTRASHMRNTCISYAQYMCCTCTTHVFHKHNTCISHARTHVIHMENTCISHARTHVAIPHAQHMYFTCPAHVFHVHFACVYFKLCI